MTKRAELENVAQEIIDCPLCKVGTTGKAVPGEGSPDATVVFVGEAPGKEEAKTGRPFIGRSGKLLRQCITSIGLSEKSIFIASVGKYLPTKGTPSTSQILHAKEHLHQQLAIISPKIIVLLGAVAAYGVLGEKIALRSLHGVGKEKDGIWYFFMFHPAAGLRFPPLRKEFLADFEKFRVFLQKHAVPLS